MTRESWDWPPADYGRACDRHSLEWCTVCTPRPFRGRQTRPDEVDTYEDHTSYGLPYGAAVKIELYPERAEPMYSAPPSRGFGSSPEPRGEWTDTVPIRWRGLFRHAIRSEVTTITIPPELTADVLEAIWDRAFQGSYNPRVWRGGVNDMLRCCLHGHGGEHVVVEVGPDGSDLFDYCEGP